ncbi:MAG: tRNA uridine(34) 5-carboxymethylaminomethyl modification radical SAM/GNAT enzyme Elp3 [Thaumarchaeota archaeon]|nr:MAG: tRNA uridine(34) 5-carboxymethylaminomethyl modification radical SAM/GNAT enzyme Elp3 [Nitrososphaerota archaeon]TLX88305.1 MAG: tRNA uridine(34) 5-carboxymethylaminomethyl modification radical SAM/GNAT enzyme Elp3 [Nitrososphaerota archaeon]TLX91824.1 MAG: tRNA uridine(34) 5-carboxymethylaminomethyl modification radical SAM/GNAT enzyme Elp3 [Nitrososphaerota archaeon]
MLDSNSDNYDLACIEISNKLSQFRELSLKDIYSFIRASSSKYNLSKIPKFYDIMKYLPADSNIRKLMMVKPIKTASGVLVITVMAKPYDCPHGKCIYCPGGKEFNVPLSYTGKEPVTKLAQKSNFEPKYQITSKLKQEYSRGHNISKVEIVIVGGTFPFMPDEYQRSFIKKCFDALNGIESNSLQEAQKSNEANSIRCVGFTVETKPDYCKEKHIDLMLEMGITRIEIGVQTLSEEVYRNINRGHNIQDVYESFQIAKDAGYKVVAHMMPGLPGSSPQKDLEDFNKLFEDSRLKPDMLKIYPTLLLRGTGLAKLYEKGIYKPYPDEVFTDLLLKIKKIVPPWVRIMRIQREIESNDILYGYKSSNIRQILQQKLREEGLECSCIRCREVGIRKLANCENIDISIKRRDYDSSNGKEVFLSLEDDDNKILFGFLRLRKLAKPYRTELKEKNGNPSAIVRELHVFGQMVDIGSDNNSLPSSSQHKGYGAKLLEIAENIVKDELGLNTISIISAIGTRQYYEKFGYSLNGPYVTKEI